MIFVPASLSAGAGFKSLAIIAFANVQAVSFAAQLLTCLCGGCRWAQALVDKAYRCGGRLSVCTLCLRALEGWRGLELQCPLTFPWRAAAGAWPLIMRLTPRLLALAHILPPQGAGLEPGLLPVWLPLRPLLPARV